MIGDDAHHVGMSHTHMSPVASAVSARVTPRVSMPTHLHAAALCVGDGDAAEAECADEREND